MARLTYPFNIRYPVTDNFLDHKKRNPPSNEPGVDIAAPRMTPVYAPLSGSLHTMYTSLGGLSCWISNGQIKVYMAHLEAVRYINGDVKAGQHIAYVGDTGNATGPVLHLSTHVKNQRGVWARVDPATMMIWLDKEEA